MRGKLLGNVAQLQPGFWRCAPANWESDRDRYEQHSETVPHLTAITDPALARKLVEHYGCVQRLARLRAELEKLIGAGRAREFAGRLLIELQVERDKKPSLSKRIAAFLRGESVTWRGSQEPATAVPSDDEALAVLAEQATDGFAVHTRREFDRVLRIEREVRDLEVAVSREPELSPLREAREAAQGHLLKLEGEFNRIKSEAAQRWNARTLKDVKRAIAEARWETRDARSRAEQLITRWQRCEAELPKVREASGKAKQAYETAAALISQAERGLRVWQCVQAEHGEPVDPGGQPLSDAPADVQKAWRLLLLRQFVRSAELTSETEKQAEPIAAGE